MADTINDTDDKKQNQSQDENVNNGLTQKEKDKTAKQEHTRHHQLAQKQIKKEQGDALTKSKAELRAERRALQDAQRAAKAAGKDIKRPPSEDSQAINKKGENQQNIKKNKIMGSKMVPDVTSVRVAYNVQMDDEKVQKKVVKKLAKQNVPQRSMNQKKVHLFAHLHQYEKQPSLTEKISFSSGSIHHAIIKLGLQYAEGIVTGSNARCISLLYALKQVITDYATPPCKELSRDLESKIKPSISFLSQCRHLSVSMGNAIKYLKIQITQIPPDMPESDAKQKLLESIDDFIQERIELAGKQICNLAFDKIQHGDKVLTFAFSSLILQLLKYAKQKGTDFEVVVVDCRPDFPGRETVRNLMQNGIKCTYCLINAVSYIIKDVTTVILGADALLANGNVMARAGSAMVSMVAKANNVPVLVCCETYKFCERVHTDSIVFNELGDPDALVELNQTNKEDILTGWRKKDHLYLLNLVYDVTPSSLVDMVVTEIGMIPCTSVPVVLRVKSTER